MITPQPTLCLGFVGAGRITRVLLEGLQRRDLFPARVLVCDRDGCAAAGLKSLLPGTTLVPPGSGDFQECDVVFLAVPPTAARSSLTTLAPSLGARAIVVSLLPGVTLAQLSQHLGGFLRLARLMPNAPALVNVGFNPICFSPSLTEGDKQRLANLCMAWGCCPQVLEEKLEAYALLTAAGPGCLWFQLYALRQLGQSFGLTQPEAQFGLERMLTGMLKVMSDSGLPPTEVQDLVGAKPLADLEASWLQAHQTRLPPMAAQLTYGR